LLLLALGACVGGNSGAEGETEEPSGEPNMPGGSTVPCPCGALRHYRPDIPFAALRVTVVAELGDDRLSLRLEEVLAGSLPLASGEMLEATWDGKLPCFAGCADVVVGDEALAFYSVEDAACEERARCVAECDAENAANQEQVWELRSECSDTFVARSYETGRDCKPECMREVDCPERPPERYRKGSVRLAPWSDPLVFARGDGGEVSVAVDDLDELWPESGSAREEIGACVERFGDWSQLVDLPGA
jgi:hypothetical protein